MRSFTIRLGVLLALSIPFSMSLWASDLTDYYQQLQDRQKQLQAKVDKQLKERDTFDMARQNLIQQRKSAAAQVRRVANTPVPPIDYSKYDRCPNGNSWDNCNHTAEKREWLDEQLDAQRRFQRELQRNLEDLQKRNAEILDRLVADLKENADRYTNTNDELNKDAKGIEKDRDGKLLQLAQAERSRTGNIGKDNLTDAAKVLYDDKAKYEYDSKFGSKCNFFQQDMAKKLLGKVPPELQGQANDIADKLAKSTTFHSLHFQSDPQKALDEAQNYANKGKYAIISLKDTSGHGHLANVVPLKTGDAMGASAGWSMDRVPQLSQAGAKLNRLDNQSVFDYLKFSEAFKSADKKKIEIYIYDPQGQIK